MDATKTAPENVAGSITLDQYQKAAELIDWKQVALNGGPPCFHYLGGRFCMRAERWEAHGDGEYHLHPYTPLTSLLNVYRIRCNEADDLYGFAIATAKETIAVLENHRSSYASARSNSEVELTRPGASQG